MAGSQGRPSRSDLRRRQIVIAAAHLFDWAGYAAVSLSDVSDVVGVAKPTLYSYFAGKRQILAGIQLQVADFLDRRFGERLAEGASPYDQLVGVVTDIFEMHEVIPGHRLVYVQHQRELPPAELTEVLRRRRSYEERVTATVCQAVADGSLRPVDPRVTTWEMFGMVSYSHHWYRPAAHPSPAAVAGLFWSNLATGIRAGD